MNIPKICQDILAALPKKDINVSPHHTNGGKKAFLRDTEAILMLMNKDFQLIETDTGAQWLQNKTGKSLPFAIAWKAKKQLQQNGYIKEQETQKDRNIYAITEKGIDLCNAWYDRKS